MTRLAEAPAGTDDLRPFTRWLAVALVPVLGVATILLYGFPTRTATLWAWTIDPPLTAMFLARAYVGGIWFFARTAVLRRWQSVALGFPAVVVFATLMALATVLHVGKFHHGTFLFTVWAIVYATTPFLAASAGLLNRRAVGPGPGPDASGDSSFRMPLVLRAAFVAFGVCALVGGLSLFAFGPTLTTAWAWDLTPLTARIVGAILTLPGLVALGVLREGRWASLRMTLQAQLVSLAAVLIAFAVRHDDLRWDRPVTVVVVGGVSLVAVFYAVVFVRCERVVAERLSPSVPARSDHRA